MPKFSTWVGRRVGALQELRDSKYLVVCREGDVATVIAYTHALKFELDVEGIYLHHVPASAIYLIDQPESLKDRVLCYFGSHEAATSAVIGKDLGVEQASLSSVLYQLLCRGILQKEARMGPRGGIVYKPKIKLYSPEKESPPKTALERILTDDFLGPDEGLL